MRLWGTNVKRSRQLLAMTQTALAAIVGVQQATVARWEAGKRAPSDAHKVKLATALHQDVRQLFPLTRSAA